MAMPPAVIFRGLKRQYRVTFSYRTLKRILRDLLDDGQLMRCDTNALDEGRMEPIEQTSEGQGAFYFITDKGRERISEDG